MKSADLLFLSFEKHLTAKIPGGVQLCTQEYIDLFIAGGFKVNTKAVPFTKNPIKRLKLKLGIDVYEGYDFKNIANEIIPIIKEKNIKIVAINQVSLIGVAPYLKDVFADAIKIIVLSHGNESGDFLHETALQTSSSIFTSVNLWRLGAFLTKESRYFRDNIDAVLCLSETEQQINNWLGAKRTFFIPRTYNPSFLPWKPVKGRIGFVGTLNHLPNYQGLILLLDEINKVSPKDIQIRIVGGPTQSGEALKQKYTFVEYLGKLDNQALELEATTWSLFLNPVFWYSRGASTKLAQGINWGLPIVTTPAGNRGYNISDRDLITVYSPQEMAEKTVFYASNEKLLPALASETRTIATNGPTYKQIMDSIRPALFPNDN